jgi:NADPH-dependent 7-cyano-7-deazaguanine reductase QueF
MKYLGNQNPFTGMEILKVNCAEVTLTSDEVTALCPVTSQPDFYTIAITLRGGYTIESKSLKLYFESLRDKGIFWEDLAGEIKQQVTVIQKARGGITIRAVA